MLMTAKELAENITNNTHLTKRSFANQRVYLVSVKELLSILDDVVMVVIIIPIVVQFPFLLVRTILTLCLLRTSFLLGIVHLLAKKKKISSLWASFN